MKSGTNYLRLILSNYLYNIEANTTNYTEVNYDMMRNQLFPNVRSYILYGQRSYIQPRGAQNINYADFMFEHRSLLNYIPLNYFKAEKQVLTYRNPLDNLISHYFYFFKNREGKEKIYEHPREMIDDFIPKFAKRYKWIKKTGRKNDNTILVAYENLKLNTDETIVRVIKFLDLPLDENLISFSIQASSATKVKKHEKNRGKAIHAKKLKGSFIRSGKIGEWREYFNNEDINRIERILTKYGIELSEFILDE